MQRIRSMFTANLSRMRLGLVRVDQPAVAAARAAVDVEADLLHAGVTSGAIVHLITSVELHVYPRGLVDVRSPADGPGLPVDVKGEGPIRCEDDGLGRPSRLVHVVEA